MRNFLTFEIESYLGIAFVAFFAIFCVSIFFIAVKNVNSEQLEFSALDPQVKFISLTEKQLIKNWAEENNIKITPEKNYRYLINEYPAKPWRR